MVPLAFFSKRLPRIKLILMCSKFYKKLLALFLSVKHFHCRVLDRKPTISSNSLALVSAVRNDLGNKTPSEQKYIQQIKEYNFTIIRILVANNSVADALSRPPQITAMYLRRYKIDSDYKEMLDLESEDRVSDYQSSKMKT